MKHTFAYRAQSISIERALALRPEIENFHAEYCAVLDQNQVELWPEFFTEDGLYRATSRENAELGMPVGLIYAEGRDMMHDRAVATSRTQMYAPRFTLHLVSNLRILEETAVGEIESQANFLLMQTLIEGPSTVHLAGTYHDTHVRVDGQLKLKERHAIFDTEILANSLVYPI